MKQHEEDIFKTLEYKGETASDKRFLLRLAEWIAANDGSVNVAMRLNCIADKVK